MRQSSTVDRIVALVGAFALSGCYTYVPTQSPAPGTEVRVRIPIESPVEGSNVVTDMLSVEGSVVSSGDTLVLATETTQTFGNFREVRTLDTLRVSRARLASLEEKTFNRGKTIGFTALVVAGTVALVLGVAGTVGGGDDGGNGGNGGGTGTSITVGALGGLVARLFGGG